MNNRPTSAAIDRYRFKLAETPEEIEAIQRLCYRTFVVEIKQHPDSGSGRLVDKFHAKNHYLIGLRHDRVCGMVAVHDRPPFSVSAALARPQVLERLSPHLLEVRLLAIEPEERCHMLFSGLIWSVYDYAAAGGYRYLAISGLHQRQAMYEKMGFRPLGDPVRRGQADFVPMLADLDDLPEHAGQTLERFKRRQSRIGGRRLMCFADRRQPEQSR